MIQVVHEYPGLAGIKAGAAIVQQRTRWGTSLDRLEDEVDLHERFESLVGDYDYMKFGKIENKRSDRPDLHAWLLLDELFPNPGQDMVSAAEHDQIWLDVDGEQLETLTDDQILELLRCGVMHDDEHDCLFMFA